MSELKYPLSDKETLFSVGYAIYSNRERLLKKNDKVQPFRATLRSVLLQSVLLYVLSVAFLLAMLKNGFDITGVILLMLCIVYGMIMITSWSNNRRDYRYAEKAFLRSSGESGTLRFDQRGMTDVSESGKEDFYSWSEYRNCIITDDAMVLLFVNEREEMVLMGRDDATERALRDILAQYDMTHTIRRPVMKGKKK